MINQETLRKLYWENGLSLKRISEITGHSPPFLWKQMVRYGIPRRTPTEHMRVNNPRSKPKVKVKCVVCGAPMFRPPSLVKIHNLCSNKHLIEWLAKRNKKRKVVRCSYCGEIIERSKKYVERVRFHFCSYRCSAKWKWQDPEYRRQHSERVTSNPILKRKGAYEKYLKRLQEFRWLRPNKLEKSMMVLIEKHNLPYKYVGDGKTVIAGKVPDFMNYNGEKKLIELVGDFWHTPEEMSKKVDHFAEYGFKTLIIWEHEFKSVPEEEIADMIRRF